METRMRYHLSRIFPASHAVDRKKMDQGFISRRVRRKIPNDRCYTETVRAEHKTDDDDNEPAESGPSGKAGTKSIEYLLNKAEHTVMFTGCCAGIAQ